MARVHALRADERDRSVEARERGEEGEPAGGPCRQQTQSRQTQRHSLIFGSDEGPSNCMKMHFANARALSLASLASPVPITESQLPLPATPRQRFCLSQSAPFPSDPHVGVCMDRPEACAHRSHPILVGDACVRAHHTHARPSSSSLPAPATFYSPPSPSLPSHAFPWPPVVSYHGSFTTDETDPRAAAWSAKNAASGAQWAQVQSKNMLYRTRI